jgi:hypothetical protein
MFLIRERVLHLPDPLQWRNRLPEIALGRLHTPDLKAFRQRVADMLLVSGLWAKMRKGTSERLETHGTDHLVHCDPRSRQRGRCIPLLLPGGQGTFSFAHHGPRGRGAIAAGPPQRPTLIAGKACQTTLERGRGRRFGRRPRHLRIDRAVPVAGGGDPFSTTGVDPVPVFPDSFQVHSPAPLIGVIPIRCFHTLRSPQHRHIRHFTSIRGSALIGTLERASVVD